MAGRSHDIQFPIVCVHMTAVCTTKHTRVFIWQSSTVNIIQGPVSFSDIGIRAVNRLKVMQFRGEKIRV